MPYPVASIQAAVGSRSARVRAMSYLEKLLAIRPSSLIAIWPLTETGGAVADNAEGTAARDGAYVGTPALANADFPTGEKVPLFSGDDRVNIYTASLDAPFSCKEGSALVWAKVRDASVWTDAANRNMIHLECGGYLATIRKRELANTLYFWSNFGGAAAIQPTNSSTDWIPVLITWSEKAQWVKAYVNAALAGTVTGVGAVAERALSNGRANIGMDAGTFPWDGWLAYGAVWSDALTDNEAISASQVTGSILAHPATSLRQPINSSDVAPDGTIWAGNTMHLMKSTDGGQTWSIVYTLTGAQEWYRVFCAANGYIYASAMLAAAQGASSGLYRSTDGVNFTRVHEMLTYTAVWGMDEDADGNLYIGEYSTNNVGSTQIWKSVDDGATWVQKYVNDTGASNMDHVHDVRVDPSTGWIYATVGDISTDGIIRSMDGGDTWATIYTKGYQMLAMAFGNDGWIYVGTDSPSASKIYRFQDAGGATVTLEELVSDDNGQNYYCAGEYNGKVFFGQMSRGAHTVNLRVFDGSTWSVARTFTAAVTSNGYKRSSRHSLNGKFFVDVVGSTGYGVTIDLA